MKRTRKQRMRASLKRKLLLFIGALLLLIGLIFYQDYMKRKDNEAYEEQLKQEQKEGQKKEDVITGVLDFGAMELNLPGGDTQDGLFQEEDRTERKEPAAGVQPDSGEPAEPEKERFPITNLEEYASQVMGGNKYLLEESLAGWVKEKNLKGTSGTIFYTLVPETDHQSIQYYISLDDEKTSLVMLAYHPRENVVTASSCNYSQEEIIQEVWSDNGPPNRDVSPEEEALALQEADSEEAGSEETGSEEAGQ